MPGIPLDVMDKFKALFRRKKDKPATGGTAGTHTEPPKPTEAGAAVPKPGQTAQDTTAAPSTTDPTAPAAGAAPVDPAQANKSTVPTAPATAAANPVPQTANDAPKAPTSATV